MKRSSRNACAVLLCLVLLFLTSCASLFESETQGTEKETHTLGVWWEEETDAETSGVTETDTDGETDGDTEAGADAPEGYVYPPNTNLSVLDTDKEPAYLILANKERPLGEGYVPAGLVALSCNTTYSMELDVRAARALYEMLNAMEYAGIDVGNGESGNALAVTSAYRSYRLQKELFEGYIEQEMESVGGFSADAVAVLGAQYLYTNYTSNGLTTLTEEDATAVVRSYSAEAGKSEHQTGLCVDFITEKMNHSLTVAFEETEAFAWLSENAHAYGFILRYPEGKEAITGYTYEPWHYRFVGREAATEIYTRGITLEEYLG